MAAVVSHLADIELVYGYRIRVAVTVDAPTFADFDQEAWSRKFDAPREDIGATLGRFQTLRNWNLQVLETLQPQDFERTSVHSKRGEETVEQMVKLWAAHDIIHAQQIERILKTLRA